mgnify:CR=1 FL=1
MPRCKAGLHQAVGDHGVRHLDEAGDVGAEHVVAGRTVFVGGRAAIGVDVDHERFAGLQSAARGRRAGASREARPVPRGDLVAPGEGPLPFASGPAHGQGGEAGGDPDHRRASAREPCRER